VPHFDWLAFHPNFEDHQAEAGRRIVTRDEVEDAWWASGRSFAIERVRGLRT
jgi:hypothetical protein